MCRRNVQLSRIFAFLALFAVGCTSARYVGNSFSPTTAVDVYFSEEEIETDYTVMGHALGSGAWGASYAKIQEKLIKEAQHRGADAILITGLGQTHISIGEDGSQINASFLKYQQLK